MAHIRIDYIGRRSYHGLRSTGSQDWPPSPVRLLGALVAGAHALDDGSEVDQARSAIQTLAATEAPVIHTSEIIALAHPATFTEKSAPATRKATKGQLESFLDLTHLDMATTSRIPKPMLGVALEVPSVVFDVGPLEAETVAGLRLAASRVGYFGRSQDHAVIAVSEEVPDLTGLSVTHIPRRSSSGSSRGWTPQTLAWLDARHDAIMNSPGHPIPSDAAAVQGLEYRSPGERNTPSSATNRGPGMSPVMFLSSIRQADVPRVLARLAASPPSVDIIPLINTGRSPARCFGLAVRGDLTPRIDAVQAIRDALPDLVDTDEVAGGRLFDRYARATPSTSWITATPIRAFGHPFMLNRAFELAGLNGVEIIEADTRPANDWQNRLPDLDLGDGLSQWFVQFRTPEPTTGPLLVGAALTRGFGLCVPAEERCPR